MQLFNIFTLILLLVGGVNWGLVALADFNLVTTVFGATILTTLIYLLVAFSALYHVIPMLTSKLTTE